MATTDELKTPEAKARALREHQGRGTPYEVMDQDSRYIGAKWVIEGLSIQILLAPERCADGQRVIVACPDLGQKCECHLHEQGDCPGHVAYTKSRVLLSNARGVTGWKAICDACQPFWLVALEQNAHDRQAEREARRARRAARGRSAEVQPSGSGDDPAAVTPLSGLTMRDDPASVLEDLATLGVTSAKKAGPTRQAQDDVA